MDRMPFKPHTQTEWTLFPQSSDATMGFQALIISLINGQFWLGQIFGIFPCIYPDQIKTWSREIPIFWYDEAVLAQMPHQSITN